VEHILKLKNEIFSILKMHNLMLVFCLCLSIVLITLGGIVSANAGKSDQTTAVKNSGTGVWVIGLLFLLGGLLELFHKYNH